MSEIPPNPISISDGSSCIYLGVGPFPKYEFTLTPSEQNRINLGLPYAPGYMLNEDGTMRPGIYF